MNVAESLIAGRLLLMPIYEFYCPKCHTIFNFLSKRVDTTTQPGCPQCGRTKIQRQVSRFATVGKATDPTMGGDGPDGVDDAKMANLMEMMSRESPDLDEENPRQVAQMLRKLQEATGEPLGERAQEALRRMESGESPEKIEEEMGDLFGDDAPADDDVSPGARRGRRRKPPAVDETLYDL
jgi:putative FmdB family regulatory protein